MRTAVQARSQSRFFSPAKHFGVVAYLSHAKFLRAIGGLAGGALFAVIWTIRLRVDYAMGWWWGAFPETPDPLTLFSALLLR